MNKVPELPGPLQPAGGWQTPLGRTGLLPRPCLAARGRSSELLVAILHATRPVFLEWGHRGSSLKAAQSRCPLLIRGDADDLSLFKTVLNQPSFLAFTQVS